MPLPRGLLKSLIREGYSAPDAMREAWRRVKKSGLWIPPRRPARRPERKNPGTRWHGKEATRAEGERYGAEGRGSFIGAHYYRGKRDAHRESQEESRRLGLNPRVRDKGSWYFVTVSKREVENFKRHWPASGLPDAPVTFSFDKQTGDLVDVSDRRFDNEAAVALSHDAQKYGRKKLQLSNPGAAWHEDQERMAEAMEKRETRPRQRTYLKGMADAHALSAYESRKMGLNPRLDFIRYVTSRQVFEIRDVAGNVTRLSRKTALERLNPALLDKALTYPNTWVQWAGKNPRPSAIPAHKLAAANRYVNLIRNKQKRDYGFALLSWLKGGAVGNEPEPPAGLSVMAAQAVRLELDAMKLWENPRGARTVVGRVFRAKRWAKRWARGRPVRKVQGGWQVQAGAKRRQNPDVEMTFNTKAKAMRYASAMRKLGHTIEVVKGQYGTYKTIIREPQKNPIAVYNPPAGRIIYGRVLAVEAQKTNGSHKGKRFRHSFSGDSRVAAYALPDGSVLLKSAAGKRLWADR